MNEEYITLNIDNNRAPSPEEVRQNTENVENVRNLDPIYEYCTAGATVPVLRKYQDVVAVWELSPSKVHHDEITELARLNNNLGGKMIHF